MTVMEDEQDDAEEAVCRYCFEPASEESGELISPCDCRGGQRWVHLSCLRRWQRMVLVSQPTHPAFYDRDLRHHECNVCKGAFTCAPPTRLELMSSFTGPELGALVNAGCIIGAHEAFSSELARQAEGMDPLTLEASGYACWMGGAYLISKVEPLNSRTTLSLTRGQARVLHSRLEGDRLSLGGTSMRLLAELGLEGAEDVSERLGSLTREGYEAAESEHIELALERDPPPGRGDDHVTAVNLARERSSPLSLRQRAIVQAELGKVTRQWAGAADVTIEHYIGGPCSPESIACCLVTGGLGGQGWTFIDGESGEGEGGAKSGLAAAVELAYSRALVRSEEQGGLGSGAAVRLGGLVARADLNGREGITLRFVGSSGRWQVRLPDGSGLAVRPSNLQQVGELGAGRVLVWWGDAQWSRTQLLGELARGHWGLCKASVSDLIARSAERRAGLEGRLVFSPTTEMTERFIRQAGRQMEVEMERNALANVAGEDADASEEGVEAELAQHAAEVAAAGGGAGRGEEGEE